MTASTPADKNQIKAILSGKSNSPGDNNSGKSAPSSENVTSTSQQIILDSIGRFSETFVKAIEEAGKSIKSEDCTDRLKKGIDTLLGEDRFTRIVDKIDSISKKTSIDGALRGAAGFMRSTSALDSICFTLHPIANMMIQVIEALLTLANRLFKKIDAFVKRLEAAIKFFIQEVRDCIIKIIRDIEAYIAKIAGNISNMDALIELLDSPCGACFRELLINMFPKACRRLCENETTGAGLVECLKTQVAIKLGVDNLIPTINQYIQEYFMKYLTAAFDILEKIITDILNLLMKPLRWAIKAYCRLLHKQIPIPFIIKGMECFYVHTKTKKGKRTIYTMSVIQIVDTLKLWAACFDSACGVLVDGFKRKIKNINEDFRFDSKYWLGAGGAQLDIYWACIETDNLAKDSDKKSIWTSKKDDPFTATKDFIKKSMIDLSREKWVPLNRNSVSCFDPETPATPEGESAGSVGLTETESSVGSSVSSVSIATTSYENLLSLHSSIKVSGPDDEFGTPDNNGNRKFYSKFVEESIIKTVQNIGGVINYHNWRLRVNEIMKWLTPYNKSQVLSDTIISAKNRFGESTDDSINPETLSDFLSVLPTYVVHNDYSTLNTIAAPDKLPTESMIDYYARWFGMAKPVTQSS